MSLELTARKVTTWIVGTEIPAPQQDYFPPVPVEIRMEEIHHETQDAVVRAIVELMCRFDISKVDIHLGRANVYYEPFNEDGSIGMGREIAA